MLVSARQRPHVDAIPSYRCQAASRRNVQPIAARFLGFDAFEAIASFVACDLEKIQNYS